MLETYTITTKGQVTIPVEIRQETGIAPGSRVGFALTPQGHIEIIPVDPRPRPESAIDAYLAQVSGSLALPQGMDTNAWLNVMRGPDEDA